MARFWLAAMFGAVLLTGTTLLIGTGSVASAHDGPAKTQLLSVQRWLLLLNNELAPGTVRRIADSPYDMAVVDDVATLSWNARYDIRGTVKQLQQRPNGSRRLVLSYLNVGQAEDYRNYFSTSWKQKPPDWIIGADPEGWTGNYPVAYWRKEWKTILVGQQGLVQRIARDGFDGAYMDWVAGYWDDAVQARAHADGVDPRAEMILLLRQVAYAARQVNPQFLLIVQNAPDLIDSPDIANAADGFVQESIWFTGAEGDNPSGDCPMPRTEAELKSPAYLASLPADCRRAKAEGRAGALDYVQEAQVVPLLSKVRAGGLAVFTVDYAVKPGNVAEAVRRSQALGFRPFVGGRGLKDYLNPQF